nr:MFS transporter [Sphingomonas arenae]
MGLVAASTVVGLMGTDLVLPAVPRLPEALHTNASAAQLVLAAYVGGTCFGLLAFGALSERYATSKLFIGSLFATAIVSLLCALARSIEWLIGLRALQGAVAAAPAVFAPAIIKTMFDQNQAVRAIGLLGSIESLAPALAPIVGAGLLLFGGWQMSFYALAGVAALLGLIITATLRLPQVERRAKGSYISLLTNGRFMRYALSQAFVLGGLLTFVLGLPVVIVRVLGGTLSNFIAMQVTAIVLFMVAANNANRVVARFGVERTIMFGTILCAFGGVAQLTYALSGGKSLPIVLALFVPVNIGLGLRGPPGFYCAVVAACGDDARGAALVVLGILAATAGGTALVAPYIERGLVPLSVAVCILLLLAVMSLSVLPPIDEKPPAAAVA